MDIESAIRDVVVRLSVQSLDAYEVLGLCEETLTIETKQQMLERIHRAHRSGISIRTIKDGRMGLAATKELTIKAVHQSMKEALDSMHNMEPSEGASLPYTQEESVLEEKCSRPLYEISEDEKINLARRLESIALSSEKKVTKVQHPRYEEVARTLMVVNSHDICVKSQRSLASCDLRVVADDGYSAESAYELDYSTSFDRLDAEQIAHRAAKRAVAKLGARSVPGGRFPVMLSPRAAAAMVKLISSSFFADNVQRGKSILRGKLGECFYDPSVTIVDDGLLPDGYASFQFDWEGVPRRRTMMVRDGTVVSWLYDGARAARDGVKSTGNCLRAGLTKLPGVGISNCFLKAGSNSYESMISGVDKGVLATDLLGLHTANPISGDFSLGLEGFIIEAGAVGDPVRGVTIAGNIHELFKNVLCVGNDLEFFGACGAPSLLVKGLMLGG
ncbi:MAG: TldD/PmbA family protein [Pseudomonadota bacterium]